MKHYALHVAKFSIQNVLLRRHNQQYKLLLASFYFAKVAPYFFCFFETTNLFTVPSKTGLLMVVHVYSIISRHNKWLQPGLWQRYEYTQYTSYSPVSEQSITSKKSYCTVKNENQHRQGRRRQEQVQPIYSWRPAWWVGVFCYRQAQLFS